ncbi:MAG: hypothetical protein K0R65_2279 [Crocinitomicaceae bacterium]|jgi:hypothetical protein|nr:hypothetical protein [Crocinitomicaceae bacterium]
MKNLLLISFVFICSLAFAGGGAPANDNCAGAVAFPAIPTNGTTACLTNRTTNNATNSNVTPTGSCTSNTGTPDDDIWFTFVATTTTHILEATYDSGSSSDIYWQVFSGACGASMTSILCTDNNAGGTISGLTVGNTYRIRMYTYFNGDDTQYDICMSSPPAAPGNDNCTGATAFPAIPTNGSTACLSNQSSAGATNSNVTPSGSCTSNSGTPNDDVWFRFTATTTALELSTSYDSGESDVYWQVFSGGCGATMTSILCTDNNSGGTFSGLTIGNTYYVRMYAYYSGDNTQYDICLSAPPPPPANDECTGAANLTASSTTSCTSSLNGTVEDALGSSQANSCWGTPDDDVWYRFTATSTSHTVTLSNVSGSTTDMYHSVFGGTCASIGASLICNDSDASTVSGLTIGNVYYVRVFTYTSTSGQTSDFTICVTTPPPPPANANCATPAQFCPTSPVTIAAVTNTTAQTGNNYGCLGSQPNPYWYYFTMSQNGSINLDLNAPSDVDFALWGPYNTLTAAQNDCGSMPAPIDCSYSTAGLESIDVASGNAGRVYVLLITNYANTSQNISLSFDDPNSSGNCACTPLPVELINFHVSLFGQKNIVKWTTKSEKNNDYFLVQRSKDGIAWETLKMINGHGNSTSEISYQYNDERPLAGISYYRLKQVDHDGNFKYSEIQIIDRKTTNGYRLYPQPATDELKITSEIGEISSLEIIDLLGKKSDVGYKVINGEYIVDMSMFNNGIYILNIYNGQEVISEKIIKN